MADFRPINAVTEALNYATLDGLGIPVVKPSLAAKFVI